jgi:hypothetical protein
MKSQFHVTAARGTIANKAPLASATSGALMRHEASARVQVTLRVYRC